MRTSLFAACALLIGATAMAAPQATKPATKPAATKPAAAKPAAMKSEHAAGTVEKFDAATKTLTVKEKGKEVAFVLDDKTSVMKGKEKADAAALVAGSMVKIEYMAMGTTKTAEKIEVSAPAAAAAKTAKPKK